jgi:hypothetical protein
MMPRLPVNIPRWGIATMSPKGVTLFCRGMGSDCAYCIRDTSPKPEAMARDRWPIFAQNIGNEAPVYSPVPTDSAAFKVERRTRRPAPRHLNHIDGDVFPDA